jgi:hypothetical protein
MADPTKYIYSTNPCNYNEKVDNKGRENMETYTCKGHHMTFHGDPLRDPLLVPKEEGMMVHNQLPHLSIFFVYPRGYFPAFLGRWEFNTEPNLICCNRAKLSDYFNSSFECKGHGNAHLTHNDKSEQGKGLVKLPVLSYHGDPTRDYRFRLYKENEKFPDWHPDKYHLDKYKDEDREVIYRRTPIDNNKGNPCNNFKPDPNNDSLFYC